MRGRRKGDIEIFSLSAIDLFAAAMAAFALLAIVLLPYYQKEIQERTPENAISDLLRAAETSAVETEDKRKALEKKRSAMALNVSDVKSEETELLAKLKAAEAALREKKAAAQRAVIIPEPKEDKPTTVEVPEEPETIIEFRFLGMDTQKTKITVALDMNRCMGGHEDSVAKTMERIIYSLQPRHALEVVGFQQTDRGPKVQSWPTSGGPQPITGNAQGQALSFSRQLTRQFGGSASMLDAFDELFAGPSEAIFLVSDGLPNPRANNGLAPNRLLREITKRNGNRKEIHTVVVGNYFDYEGTVSFMEQLARANNGQFMALASLNAGVCD